MSPRGPGTGALGQTGAEGAREVAPSRPGEGRDAISLWFWRVRPRRDTAVRLFCFPHSGADASLFAGWQERFPAGIEIWPVQLPGRANRLREAPFRRMPELVRALSAALVPHLDRPFAFFGHSLGALIAFEVSCYLRSRQLAQPRHLFVSGHPAPGEPVRRLRFHDLPEAELLFELRRLGGTPEGVLEDPELRTLFLPILRADFELCETYRFTPGVKLDCPLSAYGGLEDPYVTRSDLEQWRGVTAGPFVVRIFPGNHFYSRSTKLRVIEMIAAELGSGLTRNFAVSSSGEHYVQR